VLDALADRERRHLPDHLRDNPVAPRPTTEYSHLMEESTDHAAPPETPAADPATPETRRHDDPAERPA
jgi:hypothetical protein